MSIIYFILIKLYQNIRSKKIIKNVLIENDPDDENDLDTIYATSSTEDVLDVTRVGAAAVRYNVSNSNSSNLYCNPCFCE